MDPARRPAPVTRAYGVGWGRGSHSRDRQSPPSWRGWEQASVCWDRERAWCPPGSFPLGGPLQGTLCPTEDGLRWKAGSMGSLLRGGGCGAGEVSDPGVGGCWLLCEAALVGAHGADRRAGCL